MFLLFTCLLFVFYWDAMSISSRVVFLFRCILAVTKPWPEEPLAVILLPARSSDLVRRTLFLVDYFLVRSQKFFRPIGPLVACCKAAILFLEVNTVDSSLSLVPMKVG